MKGKWERERERERKRGARHRGTEAQRERERERGRGEGKGRERQVEGGRLERAEDVTVLLHPLAVPLGAAAEHGRVNCRAHAHEHAEPLRGPKGGNGEREGGVGWGGGVGGWGVEVGVHLATSFRTSACIFSSPGFSESEVTSCRRRAAAGGPNVKLGAAPRVAPCRSPS